MLLVSIRSVCSAVEEDEPEQAAQRGEEEIGIKAS